jgi:shikimate kinase
MVKISKNIVLIGMRGTGKTAVGRTLAEHLGWEFVDVDRLLEEREGVSIPEIVKKHDWEHFRDLETKYTTEVSTKRNTVIATGGGVILRPQNIEVLKKSGVIALLHSPLEHLANRVKKDSHRPSLTGDEPAFELEKIWRERRELYEIAADVIVNFDFETRNKKTDLARKSKLILKTVQKFLTPANL